MVEDEEKLATSLKKALEAETFAVDIALTGTAGYEIAFDEEYDLIILDLGLPGMDGMKIARALRKEKVKIPILMLTARDSVKNRVEGLNAGADDYLVKPFEFEELLARIKALLRRPPEPAASELTCGSLMLNPQSRVVRRARTELTLSAKEYALLEFLIRNKGSIVTKQQIIDHVWDMDLDPFSNTVDVYIGYVRNKVDRAFPKETPLIKTVKGMGYRLG